METIRTLIEALQKQYTPETPCAWNVWVPQDVESVRKNEHEMEPELSAEDEAEVLHRAEMYKDCSRGVVTWDVLEKYTAEVIEERRQKRQGIVQLAADSVAELRACDVYRVLDEAREQDDVEGFSAWLKAEGLHGRALEVLEEELNGEVA